MAAATVASSEQSVFGNKRVVFAKLTAPADGDTWATGLTALTNVQITYVSTTIAAADAVGVNSVSGGTVTFEVVGTARDIYIVAWGI